MKGIVGSLVTGGVIGVAVLVLNMVAGSILTPLGASIALVVAVAAGYTVVKESGIARSVS